MRDQVNKSTPKIAAGIVALGALMALISLSPNGSAQGKDDGFKNLKVLSQDISRDELMEKMKGFTAALGVRCVHCHVGDESKGLASFDFAADDKAPKNAARVMMEMVSAINSTHLAKLGDEDHKTVECATCHHGLPEPERLEDALVESYDEGGVDAALAKYDDLREKYYGSDSYDFGEGALAALASHAEEAGSTANAIQALEKNVELNPKSAGSFFQLGELYATAGDKAKAIASYEKALEFFPGHPAILQKIEALKK